MTEFITRSRWTLFDKFMAFLVIFGLITMPYIGRIEGLLLPVADDFAIERYEPTSDGQTRIWGQLTVERSCDFIGTEWYVVSDTRQFALAPIVYEPGPKLRPLGRGEFGPWRLDIAPELVGQIRGLSIHQCPFRPWRTVTPLYP